MKKSNNELSTNISNWIIENNHQYTLVNKPAGIPSQSDKTEDGDLLTAMQAYCKKDLKLINRLDRPVSGCILMGKSQNAIKHLSNSTKLRKTYLAIVHPTLPKDSDDLIAYLNKGTNNKAYVSNEPKEGYRKSEMSYRLLHTFDKYQLVEVVLSSGRFHQIRAMLSNIGCPVKGDVKYGARRANKDRAISLHAWKIELDHPVTGKIETYTATLPDNDTIWALAEDIINTQ